MYISITSSFSQIGVSYWSTKVVSPISDLMQPANYIDEEDLELYTLDERIQVVDLVDEQ